MSNTQPKREEDVKKQHAFLVGEDEAAPTAALERQIGNGIDDLIEDDAADPQLAKHPRLVAEKNVVTMWFHHETLLGRTWACGLLCWLSCVSCAVGSKDASSIASRRRALASASAVACVVLFVALIVSVNEFQMVI